MIIANPIYDVVFKLLMAETDIAKEIISRVIGRDVLKLNLSHIERKEKEEAQKEKQEAQKEKEGILQQAIQALMKTGLSEENARKALNPS